MSTKSAAEEAFTKFCTEEGKLEPTGVRRKIWNGAIEWLLAEAEMKARDMSNYGPYLWDDVKFVFISGLKELAGVK